MDFELLINRITKANEQAIKTSKSRWDSIAKPLGSLGILEESIIKISGIIGTSSVKLNKKALITMCADNGVVEEGVTQAGQEITAIVTENFTKEKATVSIMCKKNNIDLFPIDIGIYKDMDNYLDEKDGLKPFEIINRKISYGTKNLMKEPAMTKEETIKAIKVGIELVKELKNQDYNIIATGEMGIGNTTTSSSIAAVLLNKDVKEVTGKGAGLSNEGLNRKINVINEAIKINKPNPNDPLDVLCKLGGFDIAGLVGVFIGGAVYKIPILIDGFISAVAALVAYKINPLIKDYMLASHVSKEPAGKMLLDYLGLKPFLNAEMCLGEGSGAICAIPILELSLEVYNKMSSFNEFDFKYIPL